MLAYALAPKRIKAISAEGSYVYRVVLAGETVARDIWCRNPGGRKRRTCTAGDPLDIRRIQNCRHACSERYVLKSREHIRN